MKVLIITRTLAEFGSLQGKIREISKLDVRLTVVSPGRWAGRDNELKKVRPEGYEFLVHPCWFSGTSSVRLGNHLHVYPGIADIIGRERWDLVHIDEEPFNLATFHALRRCHQCRTQAIFSTWQNLMKAYPPPFNFFEKYVFKNAAGAIAGSRESLQVLQRRGFSGPIGCVPQLGVDPFIFRKQDASQLRMKLEVDGYFVIGFVGRIHIEKGVDTLVKAFALLPKSSMLVLVGRGPYRAELGKLIDTLGLSERVRWAPWLSSDEVPEYINTFDVLVLPSRTRWNWKEQFGRVLVEAMACETFVVGSDSGEIPNVIGEAGLVFHEGDERELANRLDSLMSNPSLCQRLRLSGRERVLENFTYAKIAMDTVDFYRSVAFGSKPNFDGATTPRGTLAGENVTRVFSEHKRETQQ